LHAAVADELGLELRQRPHARLIPSETMKMTPRTLRAGVPDGSMEDFAPASIAAGMILTPQACAGAPGSLTIRTT